MRRLIYVPIIHTEADMGRLASALEQSTAALCGRERWARHKATAAQFWQMVSDYLATRDARSLKVYQDGLAANGDLSKKIVTEGVSQGSQNYAIILNLLNRGAEIISTEDRALLEEEYGYISRIIQAKTPSQKKLAYHDYAAQKTQLTVARDRFIARTINTTLRDGEVGLLFLGADHNVIPHLDTDIVVEPLKEREKVKAYFAELMSGRDDRNLAQLSHYLTSAVGTRLSPEEEEITAQ